MACAVTGTRLTTSRKRKTIRRARGFSVHAWLHRIEGDLGNAAYWYQRSGRQLRRDATRDEGHEIAEY
jgi:hypothetical protein